MPWARLQALMDANDAEVSDTPQRMTDDVPGAHRRETAMGGRGGAPLDLLFDMERVCSAARASVAGRRSTSRAAAAVDIPRRGAVTLRHSARRRARLKAENAAALLSAFCAAGHRRGHASV
jgi:hypothetical protein